MEAVKQAVLTEPCKFTVIETEPKQPGSKEVLIRTRACGICGSDIHMFEGHHPVLKPPLVMGHEFSGTIEAVGTEVTEFSVGDYVLLIPGQGCGECPACLTGYFNRCRHLKVIGGHIPGGFSEFVTVEARQVLKIPESFPPEEAAMVEVTSVAVHSVERFGNVEGKDVIVYGAGPIGISTLQVLKAFGARTVIVSDVAKGRLDLAKELGADIVLNPLETDIKKFVLENVNQEGIDGAIDCAGQEATLKSALEVTANGARIILTAIFGTNLTIPILLLQRGERELAGVQMYVRKDFETAAKLIAEGKVNAKALITHKFPLAQIQEAFRTAMDRTKPVGKVVVLVN